MAGTVLVRYSCRLKTYGCQNQATRDGYCDECYNDTVNRNSGRRSRQVQSLSDSFDSDDAVATKMPRINKAKTKKAESTTEKKVSTKKVRQKAEKSPRKKRSASVTKEKQDDTIKPVKEKTARQKKAKEKIVKPEPPIVKSFPIPTLKCAHPNCRKRSYQDNLCEFHFNKREGKPTTKNIELIDRIKPLYEQGMPIREIAKSVGSDYTTVRSRIHYYTEAGYISIEKREKELRKLNKDSAETLDAVKELYEKGMPIPEIAKTLGLRRTQVNGKIQWYCSTGYISRKRREDNIKSLSN